MQQLSLLRQEIASKVNDCLGEDAVESVTLRIGELDFADAPAPEPQQPNVTLDAAERGRIEGYVAAIADPEVREEFRRWIEKDLLSKKLSAKRRG
jgi:hypothetical protein